MYRKPCTKHPTASPLPHTTIGSFHVTEQDFCSTSYPMTKTVRLPSLTSRENKEYLDFSYVSPSYPSHSQTEVLMDLSQPLGSKPHPDFQSLAYHPPSPRVSRACYEIAVRFRRHRFRYHDNFLLLHIDGTGHGWRRRDEQSFQRPCGHSDIIGRASDEAVFERVHGMGR